MMKFALDVSSAKDTSKVSAHTGAEIPSIYPSHHKKGLDHPYENPWEIAEPESMSMGVVTMLPAGPMQPVEPSAVSAQ